MAYEKTNWQAGDVITAEKLNHMEDGIASGVGYNPILNANLLSESVDFTVEGTETGGNIYETDDFDDAINKVFLIDEYNNTYVVPYREVMTLEPTPDYSETGYHLTNTCEAIYFEGTDGSEIYVVKTGTATIAGEGPK